MRPLHFFALLLAVFAMSQFGCSQAADSPDLRIEGAWARPSAPGASAGAAYLAIENKGRLLDKLVGATSPAAETVEFHRSFEVDGVMRMERQESIEIPPGSKVVLEPGGLHIMLIGLVGPLEEGATIEIALEFETSETQTSSVPVGSR